ncbi:hypothetical protein K458DRAFT_400480 [Lentithecium fluviatile CBS 122367]|uniref:Uncharacterized protein n=1 Tax=Lentithecium fluviatile CBS 122367 TaxID=1168545 RepID=A0A6G1JI32_9PLEO|nr:hypothetical protein K458DRAFT_400480 [Lentithecium fluviatile CBS 122367]
MAPYGNGGKKAIPTVGDYEQDKKYVTEMKSKWAERARLEGVWPGERLRPFSTVPAQGPDIDYLHPTWKPKTAGTNLDKHRISARPQNRELLLDKVLPLPLPSEGRPCTLPISSPHSQPPTNSSGSKARNHMPVDLDNGISRCIRPWSHSVVEEAQEEAKRRSQHFQTTGRRMSQTNVLPRKPSPPRNQNRVNGSAEDPRAIPGAPLQRPGSLFPRQATAVPNHTNLPPGIRTRHLPGKHSPLPHQAKNQPSISNNRPVAARPDELWLPESIEPINIVSARPVTSLYNGPPQIEPQVLGFPPHIAGFRASLPAEMQPDDEPLPARPVAAPQIGSLDLGKGSPLYSDEEITRFMTTDRTGLYIFKGKLPVAIKIAKGGLDEVVESEK